MKEALKLPGPKPKYHYDRNAAVAYAHKWALDRNKAYYDFSNLGGDCTNFVSQCLYAGCKRMDYTKDTGWYYISLHDRAPAWTGVPFLYRYLTRKTKSAGPYGEEVDVKDIEPGDIIQLAFREMGEFSHSLFVVSCGDMPDIDNILINTHTVDRQNYPLFQYHWARIRFIKILGVR